MKKPSIVPKVFSTMWRLLLAPDERSPAKSLPSRPTYPIVDWQALARPTFRDKVGLPHPVSLPIHSCSQDPSFYNRSLEMFLGQSRTVEPAFEGKYSLVGLLGTWPAWARWRSPPPPSMAISWGRMTSGLLLHILQEGHQGQGGEGDDLGEEERENKLHYYP